MRRLLAISLVVWVGVAPDPAASQTNEDDRDFITGLIEDTVSSEDLTVRLDNFQGALSSQATADAITLADADGVWLRLDGLTITWDRSALLSGRVEIEELSAERIELFRVPASDSENDLPSAAAEPFTLPDLPVSIDIDAVTADEIILTQDLLGEAIRAQFSGEMVLGGGAGSAKLQLERIDEKVGAFDIDVAYEDESRQLALFLSAQEGENGIAARLLDLPERPSVRLDIAGDAPLDDFTANLALATDDVDRVTGTVALSRESGSLDQNFAINVSGDVRPLLESQYDPFFGTNTVLRLEGTQLGAGGVDLSDLTIAADQIALRGTASFDASGWPEAIDLRGQVGSGTQEPVLLPIAGSETEVRSMSLDVTYDVEDGNEWTGAFDIVSLEQDGLSIDTLALSGGGIIIPGASETRGRFTADLNYAARGFALADAALSEALGQDISGTLSMGRLEQEPFVINAITLEGAGLLVSGNAIVKGPDDRFWTRAQMTVDAADLSRFAALSTLDLAGAGKIELSGDVQPFDGIFELSIGGQTTDLSFGIDQVDPLLTGASTVALRVDRDTSGMRLRNVQVQSQGVEASGRGEITPESATATLQAALTELALITPSLSGPAILNLDVETDQNGIITLDTTASAPRVDAVFQGTATPQDEGYIVRGDGTVSASDLSAYGAVVGQRMAGGLSVDLDGTYVTQTGVLDADVVAQTQNIKVASTALDPVLAGLGRITAGVSLSQARRLRIDALDVVFPNLTAQGAITSTGSDTVANLSARLRDISLFVSDFSGPVVAEIAAQQDSAGWQVSGDATGPNNTSARATGRVSNAGIFDMSVAGSALMALANIYIAPRQISGLAEYDLTIQGPAELSSVRGPIRIQDARFIAPNFRQTLEDINGTLTLAGGTARFDLIGQGSTGGDLSITGPIDLSAPYQAAIAVDISDYVLQDSTLYRTTAQGRVSVNGPLAGGATIAGRIDLGDVEVQVPSTGVSALGSLPAVTHLGVPMDVQQTLARASVGVTASESETAQGGTDYPIDLLIRAPSRIFVRGRGLDAELGGQLRMTGSTSNIIPIGRFELVRGRLNILGQRFELDEGYAELQGDFTPYLRLVATTEAATGTDISIIVEGSADDIEVLFESSPELPQDEVLAQLLFGRDLSSISPLQAVQLASAVATLAGNGNGGLINNLREGLDLDDFDIVTDEDGNAAVRAGKYISDNVYTDVTVGADGSSEINLNIDIDRNFTARGSVANDGETSVGIFFERDY
ncbi:translocation/assembly module TamB domain-containing protein [Octadecabacter sp. 1_MG-2023]|uniref:translocation/assembly module TamB domain-containing protein n=1 Tax=unclassified Octadecabacter TaxID=196158 RepID=UPI001C0999A4|nr:MULTISPECIES: translocation/assembly module TamB domain-containing protein [unclassified Octadecabacter]MBU2994636.1 translocation/assembly module TamB domain-containing protein [Octadecabacter sp. B2R22]MDO6734071.1 translocation/assembly module TamB domain-containing protein [Octadecabacter sp. 1_MG-2023]